MPTKRGTRRTTDDAGKAAASRGRGAAPRRGRAARAPADDRLETESSIDPADELVVAETVIYPPQTTGRDGAGAAFRVPELGDETVGGRLRAADRTALAAAPSAPAARAVAPAGRSHLAAFQTSDLVDVARLSDAVPLGARAAEASARVAEVVIGADDRQRVLDTAAYPWRAIASLIITTRDGAVGVGSGWFVSPRLLVTAGHCVFIQSTNPARHGWVRKIVVMAGRDGAATPFSAVTATVFRSVKGWTRDASEGFDYGGIVLPESSPLGSTVGTFGIGAFSDDDARGLNVSVAGYPDDKTGGESGTQWFHAQQVVGVTARRLDYLVDTEGGQSGSPVFCLRGDQFVAAAVHAYGGRSANSGTRITPDVAAVIDSWKL